MSLKVIHKGSCFCFMWWLYYFLNTFVKSIGIVVGYEQEIMNDYYHLILSRLQMIVVATPLWASVRMKLTLPKVGTWSPPGLPQFQSLTAEGKTPRLEVFFISLERPWSVDVKNGLAWTIRTSIVQVVVERKAKNQIGNLTPNHKKSRIDPTPVYANGMRHTVGKLLSRATRLL
jgi:hypothetical protein